MIRSFALISWVLGAGMACAEDLSAVTTLELWNTDRSIVFDANSVDKDDLTWAARAVVIFADSPNDPRFLQQLDLLNDRLGALAERDVILLADTDPRAEGQWRTQLRPRGFMLVIMGKDGEVELRKPAPQDVRELTRTIDKMPLRQQEIDANRFADR